MGSYITKLSDCRPVAEGTMAFSFEKPTGFEFFAGQSIELTLLDPQQTDSKGNTRTFSLASAPQESHLMVATRLRDTAFKRNLRTLHPGSEVRIEGPSGSLTLHHKILRSAAILAGGIGITPFRSILLDALTTGTGHRLFLFYSNRRPEDAAFLEELQELHHQHDHFGLVTTMTGVEKSGTPWPGEKGRLDQAMLRRFLGDLAEPIYYLAGPPALVSSMRDLLCESGVDPDDINAESFSGY